MKKQIIPALFTLLAALIAAPSCARSPAINTEFAQQNEKPQSGLKVENLSIRTNKDIKHFKVEIAADDDEREIGMMFRKSVPKNTGMLFEFPYEKQAAFWMKNTLVPLDIIFIKKDGTIANISRNAKPLDLTPLYSNGDVTGVLEIGGGESQKLGIREGQKVSNKFFHK